MDNNLGILRNIAVVIAQIDADERQRMESVQSSENYTVLQRRKVISDYYAGRARGLEIMRAIEGLYGMEMQNSAEAMKSRDRRWALRFAARAAVQNG